MSLVEYAASSSDEDEDGAAAGDDVLVLGKREDEAATEEENPAESGSPPVASPSPPSIPSPNLQNQNLVSSLHRQSDGASHSSSPSIQLPDASMLLASPSFTSHQITGSDHSSRVAAAMAESASRKRESNGSAFLPPQNKHRRGNSPHLNSVPARRGGHLIPPQLRGRSNVVTEDIGKLFVNRQAEPQQ